MAKNESRISVLEKLIVKSEIDNKKAISSQELEAANDLYNKLVQEGVIKKRGYTLKGIDDSHLYSTSIKR